MLEKALEVQFDFPANVKKKQKKTSLMPTISKF